MRRTRVAGALALAFVAGALLSAGCGFDDALTQRGFIVEGDKVCGETIVKASIEVEQRQPGGGATAPAQAVRSLAGAYQDAASGIKRLDVAAEDVSMRDRMASRFEQTSSELQSSASSASAQANATAALARLEPFSREIRDYGFVLCGGRAPAS